ncbi:MAG: aminotransferase class V-fold PLP-dependent enzyme [Clostridia bacterium]|nr:aminotransferase class V-fold PLP-dependent enzyme [Clostridia bacterium]
MIYLDNAATTYKKPPNVTEALIKWAQCGNPGRGSHSASIAASELIYKAREEIASLFGAEAENVIFTAGATSSLNTAINGIIQGKRFITTDFEHNSVRRPVLALCRDRGCTRDILPSWDTKNMPRLLSRMICKDTSAVICIHKSNITGRTMPIRDLGKICRDRGIPFIVDASQSAGSVNIDIKRDNIDILCAAGHKGLLGIQGTGIMVFRDHMNISPLLHGGSGSDSRDENMPLHFPDRLEAGTPATPAIASLYEGVRFVRSHGEEYIGRKQRKLWYRCYDNLSSIRGIKIYDSHAPGANFLFNIHGISHTDIARELDKRGICVRSGLHCAPDAHDSLNSEGAVRASFSYFTTTAEVDEFIRQVKEIAKENI